MLLEIYFANFFDLAGAAVIALADTFLYLSLITCFAAVRKFEIKRLIAPIALMLIATLLAMWLVIYPLIVLSNFLTPKLAAVLLGIPLNATLGLISGFSYERCRRIEAIAFWVVVGLMLDVIALHLPGEVFVTHMR